MNANSPFNPASNSDTGSPFNLDNEDAFQDWKKLKLSQRLRLDPLMPIRLDSASNTDDAIKAQIKDQVDAFNFILFETDPEMSREEFLRLNQRLGLHRIDQNPGAEDDAVTLLRQVESDDTRARYIPYTNRAMNWHTDGYYNPPERSIHAFSLFCVSPAAEGGDNFLLDHEYVYLLLRDTDPTLAAALMAPDMMRVPANELDDEVSRDEQASPVFNIDPKSGRLQMRYSTRPRHLIWKDDLPSRQALERLREILQDKDAILNFKLERGQGVVCNNTLHGRQKYQDNEAATRLFYRARYLDSIDPR